MSEPRPIPRPPASLGKPGKGLWRRVLGEYELSAAETALLEAGCLAYDRLTDGQAALDRDGLMLDGRYGPRCHPMTAVVRDATTLLARCFRQLQVSLEEEAPRPTPFRAKPGPRPKVRPSRRRGAA